MEINLDTREQIKLAVAQSVEFTFETYLFTEVSEQVPCELEENCLVVSQFFSSNALKGRLVCMLPISLLKRAKEILLFDGLDENWFEDYALEFVNSISGGMMGYLLNQEVFELSLPEVISFLDCDLNDSYFFEVSGKYLKIKVEVF